MSAFYEDMTNKETMLAIRLSDINHAHEQLRFIDSIRFRNGDPNILNIIFDLSSQEAYELIMKQVYFFLITIYTWFGFFQCQNTVIVTDFGLSNKTMLYYRNKCQTDFNLSKKLCKFHDCYVRRIMWNIQRMQQIRRISFFANWCSEKLIYTSKCWGNLKVCKQWFSLWSFLVFQIFIGLIHSSC